jgi:hypothetical protein
MSNLQNLLSNLLSKLSKLDNIQHMAANTFFSGQIPSDLHERIERHIAETGESKTQIIVNALSTYLDHPGSQTDPIVSNAIKSLLEEKFNVLEDRITALELSLNEIRSPNIKHITGIDDIDNTTSNMLPETEFVQQDDNTSVSTATSQAESNVAFLQQQEENKKLPALESLTSSEMAKATGLKQPQLDVHKRKVAAKYQKMGKRLEAKKLLPSPEKIDSLEPIILHGYPYNLFYLGQNDKGNNLWTALPCDRTNHQ